MKVGQLDLLLVAFDSPFYDIRTLTKKSLNQYVKKSCRRMGREETLRRRITLEVRWDQSLPTHFHPTRP